MQIWWEVLRKEVQGIIVLFLFSTCFILTMPVPSSPLPWSFHKDKCHQTHGGATFSWQGQESDTLSLSFSIDNEMLRLGPWSLDLTLTLIPILTISLILTLPLILSLMNLRLTRFHLPTTHNTQNSSWSHKIKMRSLRSVECCEFCVSGDQAQSQSSKHSPTHCFTNIIVYHQYCASPIYCMSPILYITNIVYYQFIVIVIHQYCTSPMLYG